MRRKILISLLSVCLSTASLAQWPYPGASAPVTEITFGYSLINVHPGLSPITSYNIHGGGAGFVYNFTTILGIKGEFMDYTGGGDAQLKAHGYKGNINGNLFTYEFGPQFKRHSGRFQPFGEALCGAAHSGAYASIYDSIHGTTLGAGNSNNTFAGTLGGGLDITLTHRIQFRPIEADYLFTQFSANQVRATQNNFRFLIGVNFTLGEY